MAGRRPIRIAAHSALVAAALTCVFVVWSLRPSGATIAMFLGMWLLLPYAALAVVLEADSSARTETADAATALLVVAGGLVFLILVVFVFPDPQGGIAVVFTPVYQAIAIAALLPLMRWILRRSASARARSDEPGTDA
jgi:uncharacterized membrane protein